MKRASGMLLPIASLPSKYGIGSFSKEAYEFVDILKEAGQKYWQILPVGPTGYGDSPYQSFSTFAGNPYFIDLDQLVEEGLLSEEECAAFDFGKDDLRIDYEKIYLSRFKILEKAYRRSEIVENQEFQVFCQENSYWLKDYAVYMAVKDYYGGKSWTEWDEGIRLRKPDELERFGELLKEEISFYEFIQYEFMKQWTALKSYANKNGIEIIGDIPIYVAMDSADTWARPNLFQLDENNMPVAVSGCPPDGFSETGQLWGNPLYKWEYHKKTDYKWWMKRILFLYKLYDILRIDHFRGFDEYYAIPYGEKTAMNGSWMQGPGIDIFQVLEKKLGKLNIIAEDLGFLTDSVRKLLKDTGYPGMKVLQFAFDSREESDYLPYNYEHNCIVYTGTHDNNTVKGWYQDICKEDKEKVISYLNSESHPEDQINWDFICLAQASVADICIIPVQEYLGLGREGRINLPSTLGSNWVWRMERDAFDPKLIERIYRTTKLYGRVRI